MIRFLTSLTEPSRSAGGGEGLGQRPRATRFDPLGFAEGGTVRRTAPAAAGRVLEA